MRAATRNVLACHAFSMEFVSGGITMNDWIMMGDGMWWRAIQDVAFLCVTYLPLQALAIYRQKGWPSKIVAGMSGSTIVSPSPMTAFGDLRKALIGGVSLSVPSSM